MTLVTWTWQDLRSDIISGGLAKRSSLWVPMIGFLRFFIMTHSTTHQSLWVRMNSKSKHVHIHQVCIFVSWTLENSSWVLSHPCWVLIQREWLVHLARPVLSSFSNHPEECLEVIGNIYFPWWIPLALARENVFVFPVVVVESCKSK